MRKLILMFVVAGFVYISVSQKVQAEANQIKAKTEKAALKEHQCNASFKTGNHNLIHGEKSHICEAECVKAAGLKDHRCNNDCKTGKHKLMHGEKGHVCVTDCKKTK
jgi:hypothetical protein